MLKVTFFEEKGKKCGCFVDETASLQYASNCLFRRFKLFNPSRFTVATTEIEYPCTTYLTSSDQINFVDTWRLDRENSFHTNTVGDFTNGKSLTRCVGVTTLNNSTLELLNTFFVSLFNFYVYRNGITGRKIRIILFAVFVKCLYEFD